MMSKYYAAEFSEIIVTTQCATELWRIDIISKYAAELWHISLLLNTRLHLKVNTPPLHEAELWRISMASYYGAEFWQMVLAARILAYRCALPTGGQIQAGEYGLPTRGRAMVDKHG